MICASCKTIKTALISVFNGFYQCTKVYIDVYNFTLMNTNDNSVY